LTCLFLLCKHAIEDRREPVFKLAIIVIRNDKVSDPIHALLPQLCSIKIPIGEISLPEALDKVFLNTAGGSDYCRDVSVLDKK
jgi:hypothetical protein